MTTKYTDEQIIDYLRTLREGDVLTAVGTDKDDNYTKGKCYVVGASANGNKFVADNDDYEFSVNYGEEYCFGIFNYIREGVFEIPTPAPETFYASIRQIIGIQQIAGVGEATKSVTVRVDDAGFAELEALEARSYKSHELARLYAEYDAIQTKIDELEAV